MKKILSLFPIVILFACISCGDDKTAGEKKDNTMMEKNLAATWYPKHLKQATQAE